MNAVETRRLVRQYGGRGSAGIVALNGVDVDIEVGEVRGLLGPNGAGKTTLCKILCTVLLPSQGTASVLGYDVVSQADRVKRSVGIVFGGDRGLYGRLSARQNLRFWGAIYGLHGTALRGRVDGLLDRVGLTDRNDERVDNFSRGMKQRLHLARGLISDPPVLILDEPTVGMDPVAAHDFRNLIHELRSDQRTVLLTTHDMVEAEAVCDRVTLVDRGRTLLTERPDAVGAMVSRYERVDAGGVDPALRERITLLPGVVSLTGQTGSRIRVETDGAAATREVLALLVAGGVTRLATSRPNLEEVYLHLIGSRGMGVGR